MSDPAPFEESPRSPAAQRERWLAAGLFLSVLVVAARAAWLVRGAELDDAVIYDRYVRNALAGHGLVYNPGEAWNALTSSPFAHLSLAAAWLAGDVRSASWLLAVAGTLATLVASTALFARLAGPASAAFSAQLLASSPFLYTTYGMETPLFLALSAVCLLLADAERTRWLGVVAALLVLVRSEGVLLLLAIGVARVVRRRPWPSWRDAIGPILLVGAVVLVNFRTYGHVLPQTLAAKVDQGRSGLWGEPPLFLRAGEQLDWFFGGSRLLFGALVVAALAGALARRSRPIVATSAASLAALALFYVALGVKLFAAPPAP